MPQNITGNKGEWSEMYVLLRLLSQGKIHAANENLEKLEEIYFPILKIIREEVKSKKYEYVVKDDIEKIQIYINDELMKELDKATFNSQADYLYAQILKGKDRAFSVEETEQFMGEIATQGISQIPKNKEGSKFVKTSNGIKSKSRLHYFIENQLTLEVIRVTEQRIG